MVRKDLASGIVVMGFAGYLIWEASRMQYVYEHGPGPGFLPLWIGISLLALATVLAGKTLIRPTPERKTTAEEWQKVARTIAVWASFVVMVWLIKPVGFLVSFAVLTAFLLLAVDRRPLFSAVAVTTGIVLGFYLIFVYALDVRLPIGPLGF